MQEFSIRKIEDENLMNELESRFDHMALPDGTLGQLKAVAFKLALIQQRSEPVLKRPVILIFAGDHGFIEEYPLDYKPNSTYETVLNYLNGGAAVNVFARQNGMAVKVADTGVNHRFERMLSYWLNQGSRLINKKVALGTRNFFNGPAMTTTECQKALQTGIDLVHKEKRAGSNLIGLSEIGTGNNISALILAYSLMDQTAAGDQLKKVLKSSDAEILNKALRKHPKTHDAFMLLTLYGGFEIVSLTGAILRAAELRMTILLEGFEGSVALTAAQQFNENVIDYCIFCGSAVSSYHQIVLNYLEVETTFDLGLKTGDGTAIALTYPIIEAASGLIREVATKDETDISDFNKK